MSSSGLCVSCKEPLASPNAKFCSQCGASQTRPQLCIHCKAQLPSNSPYCSDCGEPQSHPKQQEPSVKWCRYCKTQLPPDAAYCTKCSKPPMTSSQEPVKSSCILCKRSLKGTPQNCNFCSAPQDPHELSKRSFKECDQCGRRIFKETKVCIYQNCWALQKTPPSTPVHEEVGESFSQNSPTNTTNVTQSHDHSSHPLQLPQDSPDMSLQPTDKPAITKEQMLQKFKSPSPSASPSPLITEHHDGSSTDHRPDSASTSSAKRVSGPQKRSSDDENETSDAAKRAKTINEAARVSGAVTSEKVENTYGIVGQVTNDSDGSLVPRKRKPSDHGHDSLETPDSKKPETLDSTEAHDKDWILLDQEEIQHDMENEQGNKPEDKKEEKEIESRGNNEDSTKGKVKPKNNDADGARENEESYIAEASDSESESSSSNTSHKKSSSSASSHSNSTPGTPALNRSSTGTGNAPSPKNEVKSTDMLGAPVEKDSSTKPSSGNDTDRRTDDKNGMGGVNEGGKCGASGNNAGQEKGNGEEGARDGIKGGTNENVATEDGAGEDGGKGIDRKNGAIEKSAGEGTGEDSGVKGGDGGKGAGEKNGKSAAEDGGDGTGGGNGGKGTGKNNGASRQGTGDGGNGTGGDVGKGTSGLKGGASGKNKADQKSSKSGKSSKNEGGKSGVSGGKGNEKKGETSEELAPNL